MFGWYETIQSADGGQDRTAIPSSKEKEGEQKRSTVYLFITEEKCTTELCFTAYNYF